MTELADESVESIMKLIDADSISSEEIPVSDLPPTVTTLNAEDSSITEKLITYDLKFTVKNPRLSSDQLLVELHIDLEFQNKYRATLKDGRSYPRHLSPPWLRSGKYPETYISYFPHPKVG